MEVLALGTIVRSKTFELDTWGQAMDCAKKALFLRLVVPVPRVTEPSSAIGTLVFDSEMCWPDLENQNVVAGNEYVH